MCRSADLTGCCSSSTARDVATPRRDLVASSGQSVPTSDLAPSKRKRQSVYRFTRMLSSPCELFGAAAKLPPTVQQQHLHTMLAAPRTMLRAVKQTGASVASADARHELTSACTTFLFRLSSRSRPERVSPALAALVTVPRHRTHPARHFARSDTVPPPTQDPDGRSAAPRRPRTRLRCTTRRSRTCASPPTPRSSARASRASLSRAALAPGR